MHFGTKSLNQANMYENNYSILHFKQDFVEILEEYGRPHFPTITSALQAWKDAQNSGSKTFTEASSAIKGQLEKTKAEANSYRDACVTAFKASEEAKSEVAKKSKTIANLQKENEIHKQTIDTL